jgi:hypothetical protein
MKIKALKPGDRVKIPADGDSGVVLNMVGSGHVHVRLDTGYKAVFRLDQVQEVV